MNIFITGGTGFIGKALAGKLAGGAHAVRCLTRDERKAAWARGMGFRAVMGDVLDEAALREGMTGCDWVIHLANLYSMWWPRSDDFMRINRDGTARVMQCALECGVKKVVYVSTAAVYGEPAERPFREESPRGTRLFSLYARSKAAGEAAAWALYHTRGLPLCVLYPGIVLGADDDKPSGRYIHDIVNRRVPSTIFHQSVSTYVYVGDVVEAVLRAAERATAGQKYLIGSETLNGREFAEMVSRAAGVKLPRLHAPDGVVIAGSYALTWLSDRLRRPPPWGLSSDAAWTLKVGFAYDGSKAERELGLVYTPVSRAIAEEVRSIRSPGQPALRMDI